MADRVGRILSVVTYGGGIGTAGYLLHSRMAKRFLVRNSFSVSLRLGQAIRRGREQGKPVVTILHAIDGWLLF